MKPKLLWVALDEKGEPKKGGGDCIPLYQTPQEASYGWGTGFKRPAVMQVRIVPVKK